MTTKNRKMFSKVQFAAIVGVSTRTITNWQNDGMPSERSGSGRAANKIDTAAAISWLVNREVQRRSPDKTGPIDIDVERLRLVSEQADEKEISNAVSRGELLSVEDVQELVMVAVANLTGVLSGLPGRLANKLAHESNPAKCREVLKLEIDRARTAYADSFKEMSEMYEQRAIDADNLT